VCMCPTPAAQLARLECGHEFCMDCWAGHLNAKLSEGPACIYATCMAPKCDLHIGTKEKTTPCDLNESNGSLSVGPAQWKKLAAPLANYQRYLTHLHRSFVNNANVLWCLNPISCDYIISYAGEDRSRSVVRKKSKRQGRISLAH
jgi:ariadne-1